MTNENSKPGNFWFGFFIGGLVGAFTIFLLGTKEGKRLAEKLREKGEEYEEGLEEKVAGLQKKGEEFLSEATRVKEKIVKEFDEKKKEATEDLVSKMDATFSRLEELQKKGIELTEDVHKRHFKKDGKPLAS
ncbi:hypothetical protein A3J20_01065 [Candidatus Gottesmanbacteria bacterium RIFCSPLOWO2_02_FULL_42_29]|uniref:Gas vesicle protein n=2 Tax=Candidatus Gottesmaniibacteriota TaxID=1752720 RepID=A0A1F6BHK3_9BACT|nr:MAG: hypothetical protein UV09_C0049G0010 [Candidatus Gottesmanbacteria bacterium GW2011_GWA2_42_18]OGG10917.1 MAG: hypothetical protein A2781_07000 [Candidatus Gottesmanbacteria bacterium RIFCSPHIGHO2_01_FULL_42_27]OGG22940.1 MAG: hypothetical protein A3E72_00170 [Candidatus Gottesmanbacteria bacterium RIFCSPHIGHO2_12_FULL_43_26]OGG33558.1 MAG: hypothetical protein A3G68_05850 [Candidatus Gottesmanbacteria bacterium RIFCSPLOWO2_12_FULL_42_10]OGG36358.1 MAG: hypothetical protein A2968_04900 